MAIQKLNIGEFLSLASQHPVLDVRSPGEYRHAHLPGAYSLPLFTDGERKVVGTAYKQQGRETAIKIGLDFFGPRMKKMIEETEEILVTGSKVKDPNSGLRIENSRTILVYCWRGGMRSAGVAWLLDLYGFKVYTLVGGYKSFRKWVMNSWQKQWSFKILGGYTGSGKTKILRAMQEKGETVVDLEALANHRGSAFGALGLAPQPSQEMFENLLAVRLSEVGSRKSEDRGQKSEVRGQKLKTGTHYDCSETFQLQTSDLRPPFPAIWLEDESQRIGSINIPTLLWNHMRTQPVFFLDVPFEERLGSVVSEYGDFNKSEIATCIVRIQKRLGGLETKNALNCLAGNDIHGCFRILLKYYDKLYSNGLQNRSDLNALLTRITCDKVDEKYISQKLVTKQIA